MNKCIICGEEIDDDEIYCEDCKEEFLDDDDDFASSILYTDGIEPNEEDFLL